MESVNQFAKIRK